MNMRQLLRGAYSATVALDALSETELTAELFSDELALAIHGYEPVALRYFRVQPDGSLHYVTADEIAAAEQGDAAAELVVGPWTLAAHHTTNDLPIFQDVDIQFRKAGDPVGAVKTFRHIAANLDDAHLAADPSLLAHLVAKGEGRRDDQGGEFLALDPKFSTIKGYLLGHMTWMISDASGIPPADAAAAGFEEITYRDFHDTLFDDNTTPELRRAFQKMWSAQPHRDLPFRYGYPDRKKQAHLMITEAAVIHLLVLIGLHLDPIVASQALSSIGPGRSPAVVTEPRPAPPPSPPEDPLPTTADSAAPRRGARSLAPRRRGRRHVREHRRRRAPLADRDVERAGARLAADGLRRAHRRRRRLRARVLDRRRHRVGEVRATEAILGLEQERDVHRPRGARGRRFSRRRGRR